jgi:hypothetical protein
VNSAIWRGIAQALHGAYRGEIDFRHEHGQALLRARWRR